MTRYKKLPILLTLILLLGIAWSATAEEEQFAETYPFTADGRVSLENINGDVEIQGWDNAEVKVEYTKRARTEKGLERMEVRIDSSSNRIDIETDYVKRDRGWGDWGDSGGEVEYRLWVPRGARIDEIDLVNGSLDLSGLEGDVAADLVNGNIEAEGLTGDVEIETVNGDVELEMSAVDANRRIWIESVNGSIELILPAGVGADVEASTVHGRISNDFGIDVKRGRYVGRSMRGEIGGGGARVELENVNGAIRLRSQ